MSVDYKSTVFLPRTDFPMKGDLPKREPVLLARWAEMDLYRTLRADSAGREKFILHDGPPYANGHLHIGHALNKILKDVINRFQQMRGRDANYVPGWDCHGLPIEWKIEEEYRAKGKAKEEVDVLEFRKACRDFAAHWIGVQAGEFQRLGITGDWADPYTTMSNAAEAQIVRELGRFLLLGSLYRGLKPVLWSVVEKTALADAEVEYQDKTSTTIWVRFPVMRASVTPLEGSSVVIWTTTPWTIPGNRAVAFAPEAEYCVVRVTAVAEGSRARAGERLVLARDRVAAVLAETGVTGHEIAASLNGAEMGGSLCRHPLHGHGYDFDVPLLPGGFVTTEDGTGFVHIAPGHGEDDFELGKAHHLPLPETVEGDGRYAHDVPLFAGKHVFKVDPEVVAALDQPGALLHAGKLLHSYPHSWRSKAPLIFRATPQWFISMEQGGLREKALAAIDATRWIPAKGRNRIHAMVENRPDWCVSRQRSWGVPLPLFVDRETREPLRDPAVIERIAAAVEAEGSDVWFTAPPERFLGNEHPAERYEQVSDIVEVWFDSGSTHAFVLEQRPDLKWPADLYLEGSDQHRGWFHTSLLEACGTRGRAPYDAVLTHGFILDEQGRKMSKSLGNVVAPQEVVESSGADILRLWVVASDYTEDLGIGPEILKQMADLYRRLRNTLRYILGNLDGFTEAERVTDLEAMPELERWVLHRLAEMDALVRKAGDDFAFHHLYAELHNFCAVDLSAFYFDIRKDSLYCDRPDSSRRRAVRTVLDHLFSCLTAWLAPVLCFTAEEAWLTRAGQAPGESVHRRLFPEIPPAWRNDALAARWTVARRLRRAVTAALEQARARKEIGASLQAAPVLHAPAELLRQVEGIPLEEVCITSGLIASSDPPPADAVATPDDPELAVVVRLSEGAKCERCWRVLPDVGDHHLPGLCGRCDDAVTHLNAIGAVA